MIEVNTRNARAELADHLISDLLGAHTVGHDNDIANIGRPFVKKTDVDNQSLDSKVDGEDEEQPEPTLSLNNSECSIGCINLPLYLKYI